MATESDEAKSAVQDKEFVPRGGTHDKGREYEFKITTLFALRCMLWEEVTDMWMVTNADQVGDFDDIVLQVHKRNGKKVTYLFQLKHQDRAKPIAEKDYFEENGDFSLFKYSKSVAGLKKRMSMREKGIVQDLGRFKSIYFVIFTNKGVKGCDLLKSGHRDELSIWNTHESSGSIHKFSADKVSDFCNSIYLFSNQIHSDFLQERIEKELEKVVLKFNLKQIDSNSVARKFTDYITGWAKGELGGYYYLTKNDILRKLSELFLRQYMLDLKSEQFCFYECNRKAIWNEITSNKLVTIVNNNEVAIYFLKSYIGSIVKHYHMDNEWGCKLSPDAQNELYEKHQDLKARMVKTVGQNGRLNLLHIYKYLWFTKKIPIVLKARNADDYSNIQNIVKITNCDLKIVILNETGATLSLTAFTSEKNFTTLNDLQEDEQSKILQQHVELQGRSPIELAKLIDEPMYKHITSQDIIHILSGCFNIGNRYDPMSEDFVPRSLLSVSVDFSVLGDTSNKDLFVITTHCPKEIETKLEEKGLTQINVSSVIIKQVELEEKIALENFRIGKRPVHHLHFAGHDWLEWRESKGNVASIRRHPYRDYDNSDETLITDFFSDHMLYRTHVIVGGPGMGKSTLLEFLAKNAPPAFWVVKVVLNQHSDYYEGPKFAKLTASDHLKYFQDKHINSELAKAIFQRLLDEKKVLVLLDGLDEVATSNQEAVIGMAKRFHDTGFTTWITTRPHLKVELENKFGTVATKLKSFTEPDQETFLVKYFNKIANLSPGAPKMLTEKFVTKLLSLAKDNLYDREHHFTEMPLQCKLLADVFSDEFETSLREGEVILNPIFDLLYLYEEFLKRKAKILCDTFGIQAREMMRTFFDKYQKLFALTVVFDKHLLLKLFIDTQLEEYHKSEQQIIPFLQQEGIVVLEQNDSNVTQKFTINFVHRTFAEYLAAQWLCENFDNKDNETRDTAKSIIKEKRNASDYKFLFKIFDCMLAKERPLLTNIINGHIKDAETLMKKDPDSTDEVDKGGRTILHIAALYGVQHPLKYQDLTDMQDKMVDIINHIPNDKIGMLINIKDTILDYYPIEYAMVASKSLAVANSFCCRSQSVGLDIDLTLRVKNFRLNLKYCRTLGYSSLFPILLRNFAYELILWKYVDKDTNIVKCFQNQKKETSTQDQKYLSDLGTATMAELFQFKHTKRANANPDYYYNIYCASAFGTQENLLYLLTQGHEVDIQDICGNTPLHYAVIHNRCDCIQILLRRSDSSSINKRNNKGDTPLSLAVKFKSVGAMDLLFSTEVDVNIKNNSGNTPTHSAATCGDYNVLSRLVTINPNLSIKNNGGKTPLHVAVEQKDPQQEVDIDNRVRVVRCLVENGADVNAKDCNGNTSLHYAVRITPELLAQQIVTSLLDANANVFIKNEAKKTALDLAIEIGNEALESLISCTQQLL